MSSTKGKEKSPTPGVASPIKAMSPISGPASPVTAAPVTETEGLLPGTHWGHQVRSASYN